jgi:hypothetical protein
MVYPARRLLPHGVIRPETRQFLTSSRNAVVRSRLFAGGGYPPNTLLIVDRLVCEEFLVEVAAGRGGVAVRVTETKPAVPPSIDAQEI